MTESRNIQSDQGQNIFNTTKDKDDNDFALNFSTSSALSRINIKFLIIYIPIFWFSGLTVAIYWYEWTKNKIIWTDWITAIIFLPFALFSMYFLFIFSNIFFCKLFLVLINLIHKPKEGIFLAQRGNRDFEFWCLRTELKKLAIWFTRNCPLPWVDVLAFRWFGLKMDFSSHLQDAWSDLEFINLGRKVMIGQGAVIMSSMIVGKYLIIKKVILNDYVVIGGQATVAPGTIIGKDAILGALSRTTYNQVLDSNWVYFGTPASKLKENKYAEIRRDIIVKKDIAEGKKFKVIYEVNIGEDKKDIILKSKKMR